MNRTISLRRSLLPVLAAGSLLSFSGCAPGGLGVVAGLETDEAYLRRGEEFVTDEEYLAFAYEQAGVNDVADYYDADRAAMSARSGRQFTPYANAMMGWGSPYTSYSPYSPYSPNSGFNTFGTYGNGWNSPYGGYGYSPYGFSPYAGMGYNPYGGFGYNPYNTWGYNPYGTYGYNPYGYNPYGPQWGTGGGWYSNSGWTDDGGLTVSSGPRTPILTSTGTNSNYGETGLLVQPRKHGAAEPLVTPELWDQALGRNAEIEVASPPPAPERPDASPWERMLASPSIPADIRDPYTAPAATPRYEAPPSSNERPSSPNRSVTPSSPSRPAAPPATRPSRPAPSRPAGGGNAPSRSGRGG
jgi:hypothetical protein